MLYGPRRIAGPRERTHQPERHAGVVPVARSESPPPSDCSDEVRGRLSLGGQLLQSSHIASREPLTLEVEPARELRSAGDVKPLEQIAPIHLDRVAEAAAVERLLECDGVAGKVRPIQAQLVPIATDERPHAERLAKNVNRLIERVAGTLVIVLGPEQRQQSVAPMKTTRPGKREVGEQRHALGLREDGAELSAVGTAQVQCAESAQTHHMPLSGPKEYG